MISARRFSDPGFAAITAFSGLFFALCTWGSYARWAGFGYRTFDLAFYVQGVWQLLRGRFHVSVEHVPLLGNHVEPIVFLIAPIFALFPHPMVFVAVQNAALATMGPVGYQIAKRLGFKSLAAAFLAAGLLLTPAAGYIALHEFHPEALTAPLLLLMFHARLSNSVARHWLFFIGVLACKENMALLLTAYCAVQAFLERKRGLSELRAWYLWPMGVAIVWFLICTKLITPALNPGSIDYLALYDRLGSSAGDILVKSVTEPHRIARALAQSLTHGNLVWALLIPFLCLPLLKPRWLVIAAPVLLQHLLSWRASEWTIYFHYAAPLVPLVWMGLVEGAAGLHSWQRVSPAIPRSVPLLVILVCAAAQIWLGPAGGIAATTEDWLTGERDRARKRAFIAKIPQDASVLAPLPYLSHLAMREKLYSLHYVLKGLRTLSRTAYDPPPPTDYVLIDYQDSATFDPIAGYYHPTMKTVDGRIIPSSDRLLHDFLKQRTWRTVAVDELTLLRQVEPLSIPATSNGDPMTEFGNHTRLMNITLSGDVISTRQPLQIRMNWRFEGERDVFPWMFVRLTRDGERPLMIPRGLCAPEARNGPYEEIWSIETVERLEEGGYLAEAVFVDNSKRMWSEASGRGTVEAASLGDPIPLGRIRILKR